MATRFYLRNLLAANPPTAGEKSTVLPVDTLGANNATGTQETRALKTTKGVAQTSIAQNSDAQTAARDNYLARFTSDALAGTSITAQTWTFGFALAETNAAANSFLNLSVYIWRPGVGVVGFIYDSHTNLGAPTEWGATEDGIVATFAGAVVTYQAGDVLVVEVWRHAAQSMATVYAQTLYFEGATDVLDSTTTDAASYIETPQNLTFVVNIVKVTNETLEISETRDEVLGAVKRVSETVEISDSPAHKDGKPNEEIYLEGSTGNTFPPSTRYRPLIHHTGDSWLTDETDCTAVIPGPCTLKNFRVKLTGSPGVGTSYIFTVRKNLAATAVTVTIQDSETEKEDSTNQVSFVRGDKVSIECAVTGSPAVVKAFWSFLLVHLFPKETYFMASSTNYTNNEFLHAHGAKNSSTTDEAVTRSIKAQLGVARSLIVKLKSGIGAGTIGRTVRKNAQDQLLSATITSGDSAEDNVNGVLFAIATDLLTQKSISTGSPGTAANWQMSALIYELMAGVDKSQVIIANAQRRHDIAGLRYSQPSHWNVTSQSVNDLQSQRVMPAARKISKFYVQTDAFLPAGYTCIVTLLKNGLDTAITATLSDSVKEASDLVNIVQFAAGDTISVKTDQNLGTGGAILYHVRWSMISETLGQALIKVTNETLEIPELVRRVLALRETTNETLNIPEAVNKLLGITKVTNEMEEIPEQSNKKMGIVKITNELQNILETGRRILGLKKVTNEIENIPETIVKALGIKQITNETLNIPEQTNKFITIIKITNEIQNILEQANKFIGIKKTTNETLDIQEQANKKLGITKVINEIENIPETIVKRTGIVKITNEILQIPESVKKVITIVKVIGEILNIPEAGRRLVGLIKKVAEILNISETVIKRLDSGLGSDIYIYLNSKDADIHVIVSSVSADMQINLNSKGHEF